MLIKMLLRCLLWVYASQARFLEHYPSSDFAESVSQNAYRTHNDRLNTIGSVNQASRGVNKIGNQIVDVPTTLDSTNRLTDVKTDQTASNNYLPLKHKSDKGIEQMEKSIYVSDVKNDNGFRDINGEVPMGLVDLSLTAQPFDLITEPFSAQSNPSELNQPELNDGITYRQKRSLNRSGDYTPTRRRRQRGIRSSVADRIAHGFGKRGGEVVNLFPENETEAQRRYLGHSVTMATEFDDILKSLLDVYKDFGDKDRDVIFPRYLHDDNGDDALSAMMNDIFSDNNRAGAFGRTLVDVPYEEAGYQ